MRRMARKPHATEFCPACGTEFKAGRLACPECGSDANTGWKSQEEIDYQSIDIPDPDDFDFEYAMHGKKAMPRWMLVAAILALAGFITMVAFR